MSAADGTPKWTYQTRGWMDSSPALSKDGTTVFLGSGDHKLHAVMSSGSVAICKGIAKWRDAMRRSNPELAALRI